MGCRCMKSVVDETSDPKKDRTHRGKPARKLAFLKSARVSVATVNFQRAPLDWVSPGRGEV